MNATGVSSQQVRRTLLAELVLRSPVPSMACLLARLLA